MWSCVLLVYQFRKIILYRKKYVKMLNVRIYNSSFRLIITPYMDYNTARNNDSGLLHGANYVVTGMRYDLTRQRFPSRISHSSH